MTNKAHMKFKENEDGSADIVLRLRQPLLFVDGSLQELTIHLDEDYFKELRKHMRRRRLRDIFRRG